MEDRRIGQWLAFGAVVAFLMGPISCVRGPKTEHKSPLNVLSGEHYNTSPSSGGDKVAIPVLQRMDKTTSISGLAYAREGLTQIPVKGVELSLSVDGGAQISKVQTGPLGEFRFSGVFKNGRYQIRCLSSKYEGELKFVVDGYEINDVKLELMGASKK